MSTKIEPVGSLDPEDAMEYVYDPEAVETLSEHRWYTRQLVVFRDLDIADELFGFIYLKPKTELQDGQDRFEHDPVPFWQVESYTEPVTRYRVLD